MDRSTLILGAGLATVAGLFFLMKKPNTDAFEVEDGLLTLSSLIKLLKAIQKQVAEELASLKANFVRERRESKGAKKEEQLHRFMKAQLDIIERVCNEALAKCNITSKLFDKSLEAHANNEQIARLTNSFEPLSNSIISAEASPADLDLDTFFEILLKQHAIYKHELKRNVSLSKKGMINLQALIADSIYMEFGYDELQVAAACSKYQGEKEIDRIIVDIRKAQKKLMVSKSARHSRIAMKDGLS
mmetsp:Transcript_956/g.2318  ORF Transcript_956/g.2318 Transcript_956/m.2318 type:complete len:245 (+) Transcript_956:2615-3349(+)